MIYPATEKYIESLGYQVYKKWNYDGGIDIRGIKDDGSRLFVQCKHYLESGNPIGPDVVRELKGSTDLERKTISWRTASAGTDRRAWRSRCKSIPRASRPRLPPPRATAMKLRLITF